MNKENMLLACDWIEKNVRPSQWNFDEFRSTIKDGKYERVPFINANKCGTMGCFIGWCPFVPGLEPLNEDCVESTKPHQLDFYRYGRRITGVTKEEFGHLFLPESYGYDNPTKETVIARVRQFCHDAE